MSSLVMFVTWNSPYHGTFNIRVTVPTSGSLPPQIQGKTLVDKEVRVSSSMVFTLWLMMIYNGLEQPWTDPWIFHEISMNVSWFFPWNTSCPQLFYQAVRPLGAQTPGQTPMRLASIQCCNTKLGKSTDATGCNWMIPPPCFFTGLFELEYCDFLRFI